MSKFDSCERFVLYIAKVFEVFEGHEVTKVILISSTNLTFPSCQFVNKKNMIALVDLKSKPVT